MKRHLAFSLLTIAAAHATALAETKRITLQEAQKYAVERNFEIQALRKELDAATSRKGQARAGFYPEVGVAAGMAANTADGNATSSTIGYAYGKFNLFRGFHDVISVDKAQLEYEILERKMKSEEFYVGLDVEKYFHSYVYYKRLMDLTEEALATNDEHRGMVRRMMGSGLITEADRMEFEIFDALLKSEAVSNQQDLEEARVNLKKILGDEIGSQVEPMGELAHQHLLGSLKEYVELVKDNNEDVAIAAKEVELAAMNRRLASARFLPEVDFEIQSGRQADALIDADNAKTTLLLVGRLPLFSGFRTKYERDEAGYKQESSQLLLKDKILHALSDIETKFRRVKAIATRVDLEQDNAVRAKKYYDAVLSSYKRGAKNSADLRAAATNMYEARKREEEFKLEFLTERIEMERLIGKPVKLEIVK